MDIYYKVDTRFNTTADSVGILVDGQSSTWLDLKGYEEERVVDDSIFTLPVGDTYDFYCYDDVAGEIVASNEKDQINYANEIDPDIDTLAFFFIEVDNFNSEDVSLLPIPDTSVYGWEMIDNNNNTDLCTTFDVPQDINLDLDLSMRILMLMADDALVPADDQVRIRTSLKYAKISQSFDITGVVGDPDGYSELINSNKTVSSNRITLDRLSIALDRDLILKNGLISMNIRRLGSSSPDVRNGVMYIIGAELKYSRQINKTEE